MKAVLLEKFGGTENFYLDENYAMPELSDETVLVKIKASGFNPVDYKMRKGAAESNRLHSPILGREFSGTVEMAGRKVKKFKKGDEVFAASGSMGSNGTYAEYIVVPEAILSIKPREISFEVAASIPVAYLTALQVLDRLKIGKRDGILITGAAGGVGLALVKLLLASGYKKIVVTAGNQSSRNILLNSGLSINQIVDYNLQQLPMHIKAANNECDFKFTLDIVGGKMAELCAGVLCLNGVYADVTALGTDLSRKMLFDKGAVLYNISNYAYSLFNNFSWYGINLNRIAKMLENNIIQSPPVRVFNGLSVDSVSTAHEILEQNKTNGHKLLMKIN